MVGPIVLFDEAFSHPSGTFLSNIGPADKEMLWPLGIREVALTDTRVKSSTIGGCDLHSFVAILIQRGARVGCT
ncbi:hypothetical protein E2562_017655 [Oryza meyeriana var. granulata]|uniref:Uncharacterized protein n=1 Tax=Oryza meyeriana var. granulata TaxID=110450 RepID=A0A6G1BY95_9ORYZ|nr:hypothetical protein E2562_017655 [Oryza meyeriana var. granulata]